MLKKIIAIVLLIMMVFTAVIPISVSAEETYYVGINCHAGQSEAKGKRLTVYFKNIETNEEIARNITTVGLNKFTDIPAGEYEFVKCVLTENEDVEFKLASRETRMTVTGTSYDFFTFRVENTATENREGALEEYKQQEQLEILYVIACLAIIALFIVWLVFAIMGRKNYRKKMIARLLLHFMFSSIGFLVALAATSADPENFMIWLAGAGFPYGIFLTSYFGYKSDEARGYYVVRENEGAGSFVARWALILAFSAVLGIIALPIVLIIDIVKICKAGKEDIKYA